MFTIIVEGKLKRKTSGHWRLSKATWSTTPFRVIVEEGTEPVAALEELTLACERGNQGWALTGHLGETPLMLADFPSDGKRTEASFQVLNISNVVLSGHVQVVSHGTAHSPSSARVS